MTLALAGRMRCACSNSDLRRWRMLTFGTDGMDVVHGHTCHFLTFER